MWRWWEKEVGGGENDAVGPDVGVKFADVNGKRRGMGHAGVTELDSRH